MSKISNFEYYVNVKQKIQKGNSYKRMSNMRTMYEKRPKCKKISIGW